MEVVGSEIGQKMRSAIKAKLTELGCYVDDELPDYVMVMVANKRTRAQMEDDLQLFLGDNTELFVNWLHQVLKKLQEVTVTPKPSEPEKSKEVERSHSKERKSKEKKSKDKPKKTDLKKAKKKEKEKEKSLRRKEQKKSHKKKKDKNQDMIRPNIPPLLMNMEKDSEPSITDVFAGQILKNHGILMETLRDDPKETKPVVKDIKRPIVPIIDPATILTDPADSTESSTVGSQDNRASVSSTGGPRDQQLKEMNKIEAKILGLKQKLAEELDSMSEDEDFLNIRTEAEELLNDFAEDVFQEISENTPAVATPPPPAPKTPPPPPKSPLRPSITLKETPKELQKDPIETLPQIELKLPKRPIRDRLGAREEPKKVPEAKDKDEKALKSPESFTPEREVEPPRPASKPAKSRLGEPIEQKRKLSADETSDKTESSSKRLSSRVSVLENRSGGRSCASVVRVRPRPRAPAPSSSLLLRAVADAHKSLLNIPPKVDKEPQTVKRALVLPMRRCVDAQKIVIQVPGDGRRADSRSDIHDDGDAHDAISLGDPDSDDDKSSKVASDADKDEYVPIPITKKIHNTDYVPSRRLERTSTRKDDTLIIETINIHNPSIGKDKNTQFIVTMDGFNPNAFLAKKLQTEGLLNEEDEEIKQFPQKTEDPKPKDKNIPDKESIESNVIEKPVEQKKIGESEKNSSEASVESEPQIVIKEETTEKRKSVDVSSIKQEDSPPAKKRKSSPIVFDVDKKKQDNKARERTESASSDNHVTVTTTTCSHKYDSLPPLTSTEKKPVWCRAFPQCRYGSSCAFLHPRCKFAAACTRRNCPYSHSLVGPAPLSPAPVIASHVVPAANYKTISATPLPAMCKYYPACANPACHFYHPKLCRYGKNCANKLECNFYHADVPAKWRYPV